MKLISLILALGIFSLITAPVLGTLDLLPESTCCQDLCTSENEQEPQGGQEDDGCTEMCNPFLSCQCCFAYTASPVINSLKTPFLFKTKDSEYRQLVSIQALHTVWHPPKA